MKGIFAGYRILIVLFCSFACFTTFSSLNDPTPLHPRLSVCSFLSLDISLTSSSYHRLILISLVSFHASQRPLLTMLSKTSLLLCDCLIFLFTPCAILPQCFYLFPCFLSFYLSSSIWKFILYSPTFLVFGKIPGIMIEAQWCFPNVEWMQLKLQGHLKSSFARIEKTHWVVTLLNSPGPSVLHTVLGNTNAKVKHLQETFPDSLSWKQSPTLTPLAFRFIPTVVLFVTDLAPLLFLYISSLSNWIVRSLQAGAIFLNTHRQSCRNNLYVCRRFGILIKWYCIENELNEKQHFCLIGSSISLWEKELYNSKVIRISTQH